MRVTRARRCHRRQPLAPIGRQSPWAGSDLRLCITESGRGDEQKPHTQGESHASRTSPAPARQARRVGLALSGSHCRARFGIVWHVPRQTAAPSRGGP